MEGQDGFIMRKLDDADVGFREDYEDVSADVGYNTDLYASLNRFAMDTLVIIVKSLLYNILANAILN